MAPHDPTRAGPPVPPAAGPPVRLSLPEIESLCLKAARGTGRPWGLAEEAGRAASWLSARGLPGPDLVLAWLTGPTGAVPRPQPGAWTSTTGAALCPVATGAALADFAGLPEGIAAPELHLSPTRMPALLLPFVARMAAQRGVVLGLAGDGWEVLIQPCGAVAGQVTPLPDDATALCLRAASAPPWTPPARPPPSVPLDVWRRLDALALATTVPASDSSRAGAGAGAGSTDND